MTFERKIAAQGLAEVKAPSIAPTGDQKGATQTISGGALNPVDRGHKNWGQTINQGFELRSLLGTAMFKNLATAPGTFELDLGAFGYHTVRSAGPTLAVSLAKPDGVPTSQHTPSGGFRHRQRWGFLEIFYPEDTTLTFSTDFAYGIAAWRAQFWEQEDLALLVGSDDPITYAQLARDVVPQKLDALLAEAPRMANTTDLFLVSYNERTGKATVVLLSPAMEGMDPEVPEPDTTEPVPGDGTTPETPKPWEKPKTLPGTPEPDTQHDYTDPTTGLPLVPSPPPAASGTLYALHGAAISVSVDGGSTWADTNISGTGTLVDLVATPAGLFVLDDAGQLFTAPSISDAFQLVRIADTSTTDVEIPVVNGGFETGDLTGWTTTSADVPRVLRTTQPPQMPGSTHYLTRDWRIVNPQPFSIQQTIAPPVELVGNTADLVVAVDAYVESGDIARIELLDGVETVIPASNFTVVLSGGKFRANGFATSPSQGVLNLVGTPYGNNVPFALPDGFQGIALNGATNQAIFGSVAWRVEREEGGLYQGLVALRLHDLDNANGTRETLSVTGIVSYDLLESAVTANDVAADVVDFVGTTTNQTGDVPLSRFHIVVRPEFTFEYTGEWEAGLGMKGPGSAAAEAIVLASAEFTANGKWSELRAEYSGEIPPLLVVRLSGGAIGGYADVYFDNARLSYKQQAAVPQILAIASVEGNAGGAEVYLDGGLLRYVEDPAERGATVPVPTPDVSTADHAPGDVRVVSNGTQAWAWAEGSWGDPIEGPFTSVVSDPVPMLVKADGEVLNGLGGPLSSLGAGAWYASGDRRRDGGLMTEAATGAVKIVSNGGGGGTGATQPVAAGATARRSLATDGGRVFGWSIGSPDLLWTSDVGASWKVAGALGAPIVKIVEMR